MKLLDLDPRWLIREGEKAGFVFRCPTRPDRWQSCFFSPTPRRQQFEMFWAAFPDEGQDIQPCAPDAQWQTAGPLDFEVLTVTPSLDGSKAGNWHGFITSGQIVGGI